MSRRDLTQCTAEINVERATWFCDLEMGHRCAHQCINQGDFPFSIFWPTDIFGSADD